MLRITTIFVIFLFVSNSHAENQYRFKTESPIYVVGDVHGAFNEISTTLKTLDLIDADENWIGGNAHFVSLGDLMDRGPSSRKVMDLYMRLQAQAAAAGGRFHVVLGNHEVMNLAGDLRYLSAEEIAEFSADEAESQRQIAYQNYLQNLKLKDSDRVKADFIKKYPKGYFAHQSEFGLAGKYGQWLLSLPFIIQINDQVFAHGGLSSSLQKRKLKEINREYTKSLVNYLKSWDAIVASSQPDIALGYSRRGAYVQQLEASPQKELFLEVFDDQIFSLDGPTWYRGNVLCHPLFESDSLSSVLNNWKAKRLWVGHTTTPNRKVQHRLDGQLIVIDTGMLNSHYNGTPYAGRMDAQGNTQFINGLTGEIEESTLAPSRENVAPFGMNDEQLEDFLLTAKVISQTKTKEGRTKPTKMTLEKNGRTIEAIFKSKDNVPNFTRGSWGATKDSADRYQFEIAAYKLDRMLGIGLVPVTVEREIDGKKGSLQVWIEGLIAEVKMNEEDIYYNGFCDPYSQLNLLNSFDYLIMNVDRNQSNIMYSQNDWQIWFIDHSRSFRTTTKHRKMLKNMKIVPTNQFKVALKKLTREDLDTLSPWLHKRQISSIWKRRNKLIKGKF